MYCHICHKECKNFKSLGIHLSRSHNDITIEYYYKTYINNDSGKCKLCKNSTVFLDLNRGYREFCSNECSRTFQKNDPYYIELKRTKKKEIFLRKYGVDHPLKCKSVQDKIKKTNLERYGVDNVFKSKEIKEKIKETNLEKYGVENPRQSKEILQKVKENNLSKYGVDHHFKRVDIKLKMKEKRRNIFLNFLFSGNRLKTATPLFKREEFIDNETLYKFKCIKCNTKFEDNIDDGKQPRCPICFPPLSGTSQSEIELKKYIKLILPNEEIIENDRKVFYNKYELDIYLPKRNIAIEFNGLYWHSELSGSKNRMYHIGKTELCESKGIRLIHIFEDEWVDKKDIVKSRLNNIFNLNLNKLYARKCIIKEIDYNVKKNFLEKHHIQGNDLSSIKLGAYYNGELVAVMTFGKLRKCLGSKSIENQYELYRFCSSKNVIGISSKLLQYFIKTYYPIKIITYCDRRWSNSSNFYEKIGFKFSKITTPNYWYLYKHKRYYRYNFRKDILLKKYGVENKDLSEWEIMQSLGYDRIWDCGNFKYEMIIK